MLLEELYPILNFHLSITVQEIWQNTICIEKFSMLLDSVRKVRFPAGKFRAQVTSGNQYQMRVRYEVVDTILTTFPGPWNINVIWRTDFSIASHKNNLFHQLF